MDDAYGFINKDYLKKKAVLLGPRRLLKGVKLENVIAALSGSTGSFDPYSVTYNEY